MCLCDFQDSERILKIYLFDTLHIQNKKEGGRNVDVLDSISVVDLDINMLRLNT